MKDFNKDKFNDSIKKKFAEAEVQPGHAIWEGIEAELLKVENRKMQKRATFYRNLAASVILIALISIYFNLQDFRFDTQQETSISPIELDNTRNDQFRLSESSVGIPAIRSNVNAGVENENIGKNSNKAKRALLFASQENRVQVNAETGKVNSVANTYTENRASLAKLDIMLPENSGLPKVDRQVKEVSYFAISNLQDTDNNSALAWNTNVNIGSGNFEPNSEITKTPLPPTISTLNNNGTNARNLDGNSNSSNQEMAAIEEAISAPMQGELSFTVGLNFGVELNDKWSLKSGLQYGQFRSSSSSAAVLRDRNSDQLFPIHGASSLAELAKKDGKVVNRTSEYNLSNDLHIVTVPLMASYKFLDRKIDFALVGGVSADFILRNTLNGNSEQINEIKFDGKDKQSYKKVFASGMAGIEISYPLAERYSVSVMPTYKKALSNITNTEDATFVSNPSFLGLNMSIGYMF